MKKFLKFLFVLVFPITVFAQDPTEKEQPAHQPDTLTLPGNLQPDTLLRPDSLMVPDSLGVACPDSCFQPDYLRDNMKAVLWQQKSAEYKALAFQTYNFARWRFDDLMKQKSDGRPRCIIVGIDETILNNTPYMGFELKNGVAYADSNWRAWTKLAEADTIPGAVSFLKYVASQGVEIMYVTNRSTLETASTLKNLKKFGLPNAEPRHLLTKTSHNNKELRRKGIANRYQVLLLIGDDLNDFSEAFYEKDMQTRDEAVSKMRDMFGKNFILLPNPMYGSWEAALYHQHEQTEEEKANTRMNEVVGYGPQP